MGCSMGHIFQDPDSIQIIVTGERGWGREGVLCALRETALLDQTLPPLSKPRSAAGMEMIKMRYKSREVCIFNEEVRSASSTWIMEHLLSSSMRFSLLHIIEGGHLSEGSIEGTKARFAALVNTPLLQRLTSVDVGVLVCVRQGDTDISMNSVVRQLGLVNAAHNIRWSVHLCHEGVDGAGVTGIANALDWVCSLKEVG
ncbi:hypothetical protein KIPB_008092 [Kipferlia bialata]|uniref:Uncharacterized protein n=1 Tax=Kipferlia bialata TaxID=797122 RepID=A0A391NXD9_9EUKA|nr:hypothetical protein KIPB_008092 [Kipferlia bialata]|eukprot:g8092.t1